MAKTMTKAQLARELDTLRHAVSQLRADNARLMAENATLRTAQNKTQAPCSLRAMAMARAKEEAIRTGRSVAVRL